MTHNEYIIQKNKLEFELTELHELFVNSQNKVCIGDTIEILGGSFVIKVEKMETLDNRGEFPWIYSGTLLINKLDERTYLTTSQKHVTKIIHL